MEYYYDEKYLTGAAPEGRVEAVSKVTGKGKYAAEYEAAGMCYGVFVTSTIPAGTIKSLNLADAKQSSGVIDILSHINKPIVPGLATEAKIKEARIGLPLFHTDKINFKGQPIALVVAETLEEAVYAASLVTAEYTKDNFKVDFDTARAAAKLQVTGKDRGTVDAWKDARHIVEEEYTIAAEVHNPMEMHATIAHWTADDKLDLFDKSQGVNGVQRTIGTLFGIDAKNINVVSEFVGGGFGSGLRVWSNTIAAAMAAKMVNRPVKVMLTRPQMFSLVGHRPESWQKIKLGANNDGMFAGMVHQAIHTTSTFENFNEGITRIARLVYKLGNLHTESAVVPLNIGTPTWMRGPGDCTGDFAIECAIDELSYKLKEDPVALRMKNIAHEKDPENGKPWSSHFLGECMQKGAAMIQWENRKSKTGKTKEGDWKIGYGMAVGMWNAGRSNASAAIQMLKDGNLIVQTAMTDIGTGTGTAMLNIVHDLTGIDKNKIKIELGNSDLPPAPSQGGSTGLSSLSGALTAAVNALKLKLAEMVQGDEYKEAWKKAKPEDIVMSEKGIALKGNEHSFINYAPLWGKSNHTVSVEASSGPGKERQDFAFNSSAAHFCRVKVNTRTGKVKVDKLVSVADGGKIVNDKAAANQVSGAGVGGIGMALMEDMEFDTQYGSIIGDDLAGYHFPVHADAPVIEVAFINKPDPNINPSGAKGLGEVGIIGVAAAISNAIYNATGKRLRHLPITPDKILLG